MNAYGKTNGIAPFADDPNDGNSLDRHYVGGTYDGRLPTSVPDGSAGSWPASCTYFNEIYWNSWQQVVNYSVSIANTTNWNAPGDRLIPGRTGTYKLTLQITVNGVQRWYGIQ